MNEARPHLVSELDIALHTLQGSFQVLCALIDRCPNGQMEELVDCKLAVWQAACATRRASEKVERMYENTRERTIHDQT
jgi:hypothetical protein